MSLPARRRPETARHYTRGVREAFHIGIALGGGAGIGVVAAGLLSRLPAAAAALVAAVVAGVLGFAVFGVAELVAGAVGGLVGAASASPFARRALRRGGTAGGTALLVAGAGVVLVALALVPAVGYLEVVALPALALRARRRAGEKYAGLRSLAR